MPRLLLSSLTIALALTLGGCDRQSADSAQGEENMAPAKEQLTGRLDRTFVGQEIPEVQLTDPAGITLDLGELQGKPVLLNLWATWCAPCVVEMPLLDELAAELGESVAVITVSEDLRGAEKVVPFFEEKGFTNLPQWMDSQNELASAFGGGAALPLTVLYDAQGQEVWRVIGGYDWGSAEARELIAEAEES